MSRQPLPGLHADVHGHLLAHHLRARGDQRGRRTDHDLHVLAVLRPQAHELRHAVRECNPNPNPHPNPHPNPLRNPKPNPNPSPNPNPNQACSTRVSPARRCAEGSCGPWLGLGSDPNPNPNLNPEQVRDAFVWFPSTVTKAGASHVSPSPLYIPCFSPISPYISPISPLDRGQGGRLPYLPHLPYTSPVSPLYLPISPLYLPSTVAKAGASHISPISPIPPLYLPYISPRP